MNKEEQALVDIQKSAHTEWLNHPTTRQMFSVLKVHESTLIDNTGAKAEDIISAVRTIRAMRTILTDTDHFVMLANKKQ
jgi:hypothetical protein